MARKSTLAVNPTQMTMTTRTSHRTWCVCCVCDVCGRMFAASLLAARRLTRCSLLRCAMTRCRKPKGRSPLSRPRHSVVGADERSAYLSPAVSPVPPPPPPHRRGVAFNVPPRSTDATPAHFATVAGESSSSSELDSDEAEMFADRQAVVAVESAAKKQAKRRRRRLRKAASRKLLAATAAVLASSTRRLPIVSAKSEATVPRSMASTQPGGGTAAVSAMAPAPRILQSVVSHSSLSQALRANHTPMRVGFGRAAPTAAVPPKTMTGHGTSPRRSARLRRKPALAESMGRTKPGKGQRPWRRAGGGGGGNDGESSSSESEGPTPTLNRDQSVDAAMRLFWMQRQEQQLKLHHEAVRDGTHTASATSLALPSPVLHSLRGYRSDGYDSDESRSSTPRQYRANHTPAAGGTQARRAPSVAVRPARQQTREELRRVDARMANPVTELMAVLQENDARRMQDDGTGATFTDALSCMVPTQLPLTVAAKQRQAARSVARNTYEAAIKAAPDHHHPDQALVKHLRSQAARAPAVAQARKAQAPVRSPRGGGGNGTTVLPVVPSSASPVVRSPRRSPRRGNRSPRVARKIRYGTSTVLPAVMDVDATPPRAVDPDVASAMWKQSADATARSPRGVNPSIAALLDACASTMAPVLVEGGGVTIQPAATPNTPQDSGTVPSSVPNGRRGGGPVTRSWVALPRTPSALQHASRAALHRGGGFRRRPGHNLMTSLRKTTLAQRQRHKTTVLRKKARGVGTAGNGGSASDAMLAVQTNEATGVSDGATALADSSSRQPLPSSSPVHSSLHASPAARNDDDQPPRRPRQALPPGVLRVHTKQASPAQRRRRYVKPRGTSSSNAVSDTPTTPDTHAKAPAVTPSSVVSGTSVGGGSVAADSATSGTGGDPAVVATPEQQSERAAASSDVDTLLGLAQRRHQHVAQYIATHTRPEDHYESLTQPLRLPRAGKPKQTRRANNAARVSRGPSKATGAVRGAVRVL